MLDMKDKQLEWELRAHIQRLRCLLDDPDQISHENADQAIEISTMADSLIERSKAEMNVPRTGWAPIHEGLTRLILEMDVLMRDYHLVVLSKRRKYYEELSKTHWDDSVRIQARRMVAELNSHLSQLAGA